MIRELQRVGYRIEPPNSQATQAQAADFQPQQFSTLEFFQHHLP